MSDSEKRQEKVKNLKRFPHNMSNAKAKELSIEDWGTLEEVEQMAKMPRIKKNQEETKKVLEDIMKKGALRNNNDDSLSPTLSKKAIKKLLNGDWEVAANIDHLFENSIEPWKYELDQEKNNRDIVERKYLYSPMNHEDKIVPVKITVKEYKKETDGTRLHSGEIIDHDLAKKIRVLVSNVEKDDNKAVQSLLRRHPDNPNIPQNAPFVKEKNKDEG